MLYLHLFVYIQKSASRVCQYQRFRITHYRKRDSEEAIRVGREKVPTASQVKSCPSLSHNNRRRGLCSHKIKPVARLGGLRVRVGSKRLRGSQSNCLCVSA